MAGSTTIRKITTPCQEGGYLLSYLDKITDLLLFMVSEIEVMRLFVLYKPPQKHTNTNTEVYVIGPLSCGILLAFKQILTVKLWETCSTAKRPFLRRDHLKNHS